MLTIRTCKVFNHALGEYLRQADYYSQGMKVGPVLTLTAMALHAGRRDIAEIARFASTLSPTQRH